MWGRLGVIGIAATSAVLASCSFHANGAAPDDGSQAGTDATGNGSGTNGSGANGSGANGSGANGSGANGSGTNGSGTNGSGAGGSGGNGSGGGSNGSNGNGSGGGSNGSNGGILCPSGYALVDLGHPGSFYKKVTASTTWQGAETDCENDASTTTAPTHLIVLDDQAEAVFAWTTNTSDQWVGATDLQAEGTWLPVTDQQSVFTGNATGNNSNKNCLEVTQSSGQTTAETCANGHPYLCECDGNAANPQNQQ